MHTTVGGQRQSWMMSRAANLAFLLGSWSAIAAFLVEIVLVLAVRPGLHYQTEAFGARLAFFVLFTLLAILFVLNCYLWLSMLWLLIRHAKMAVRSRALWFLIVFFGLSLGAAVFYLFVGRARLARTSGQCSV